MDLKDLKAKVSRRGRWNLPEVVLAPGPAAEAYVGDGSYAALYGYPWALVWDPKLGLVLLQAQAGIWIEGAIVHPLPELPKTARHITLAWDQNARPVIAWEERGEVHVRYWDQATGAYVFRGPYPGVDPVLIFDTRAFTAVPEFPAAGQVRLVKGGSVITPDDMLANSDVQLFHLTPDRRTLVNRLQRELYEIPHTLFSFAEPVYLDQAVEADLGLELLGTDARGEEWALYSGPYAEMVPFLDGGDALAGLVGVEGGRYWPSLISSAAGDPLSASLAPEGGAYIPAILQEDAGDSLSGSISSEGGIYVLTVQRRSLSDAITGSVGAVGGLYQLATYRASGQDILAASVVPEGGYYGL